MRKWQSFKSYFSILLIRYTRGIETHKTLPPLLVAVLELSSAFVFSLYVNRVHHTLLPGVKTQAHTSRYKHTLYNLISACIHALMLVFRA